MSSPAEARPRTVDVPVAARRARLAIATAFAAQGLSYALVLNSLPVLERRHGVGTAQVTLVILGVCVVAAGGTVLADRLAASGAGRPGGRGGRRGPGGGGRGARDVTGRGRRPSRTRSPPATA